VLQAMGISRQSMYDTFGDKRRLYLEALERYSGHSVTQILASLQSAASPLAGIEAALVDFASRPQSVASLGCLGVSSVCEFGVSDDEVSQVNQAASKRLASAFERVVAEGQQAGEIDAALKPRAAVQFILAMLTGMKVAARGGASIATLREMARVALRSLRA
jgi:AcrR family transcriptional regulator